MFLVYISNDLLTCFLPPTFAFSSFHSSFSLSIFLFLFSHVPGQPPLHFSLLHKITGHMTDYQSNSYLLPLMGVTDQWLVQVAVAVHLAQWLLCCSPVMDTMDVATTSSSVSTTDDCDQASLELSIGYALQDLWLQLRHRV